MEKIHFVGIGGIGMSGLASWCRFAGMKVSGSDRGAGKSENAPLINSLKKQGITIFPQDGSFMKAETPEALVYSSAIEEDNPDFKAGSALPRIHRSKLLAELLAGLAPRQGIAVAGSCGKSTVTAYLAEALLNAGEDPGCLDGALSKRFANETFAGNFRPGKGKYFVFEADESDKSLVNYSPDYALILNMGTDHYPKEELAKVFAAFLNKVKRGAVLERDVFDSVKPHLKNPALKIAVFDGEVREDSSYFVSGFRKGGQHPQAEFNGRFTVTLPAPGFHTAKNALAVFALLTMLGIPQERAGKAIERFDGIRRRNDFIGTTSAGALVYDDYAHNPEKISSCMEALREVTPGRLFAVFQPHGYGPLGFFREELFHTLEGALKAGDEFLMLPPYYAGGTSSFKPTSQEVISDWKSRTKAPAKYSVWEERETLKKHLLDRAGKNDLIVIMGARDNSLPLFGASLLE